jgi:anti-anti-sigma factor
VTWAKFEATRSPHEGDGIVVYRLHGNLTDSREAYHFYEEFRKAVKEVPGLRYVIFSLEEIDHVTSAGVGILAACFTSVANCGGTLCLSGLSSRARAVLEIVGLLKVIEQRDSEEELLSELRARGR